MNWLRQYWIIPVIALIIGLVMWFILKGKNTSGVNDGPPNNPGLLGNEDKYLNWGVTVNVNKQAGSVTIEGQGNGNYFNGSWTLSQLSSVRNSQTGSYGTYWQEVLVSEYSSDGDFYIGAVLAGEVANNVFYIFAGVWDPNVSSPNIPNATGAKAALRVNNLLYTPETIILVNPGNNQTQNSNKPSNGGGSSGKS